MFSSRTPIRFIIDCLELKFYNAFSAANSLFHEYNLTEKTEFDHAETGLILVSPSNLSLFIE